MSYTPLEFGAFVDTTDSEQRWQIYNSVNIGAQGSRYVNDTSVHNGSWKAITIASNTIFSSLVGNISGIVGNTIPAGVTIYGVITSFTLTSGSVIAYNY
jgi:hypothetical protein